MARKTNLYVVAQAFLVASVMLLLMASGVNAENDTESGYQETAADSQTFQSGDCTITNLGGLVGQFVCVDSEEGGTCVGYTVDYWGCVKTGDSTCVAGLATKILTTSDYYCVVSNDVFPTD